MISNLVSTASSREAFNQQRNRGWGDGSLPIRRRGGIGGFSGATTMFIVCSIISPFIQHRSREETEAGDDREQHKETGLAEDACTEQAAPVPPAPSTSNSLPFSLIQQPQDGASQATPSDSAILHDIGRSSNNTLILPVLGPCYFADPLSQYIEGASYAMHQMPHRVDLLAVGCTRGSETQSCSCLTQSCPLLSARKAQWEEMQRYGILGTGCSTHTKESFETAFLKCS
ncbi:hypothetical protein XENTR_v10020783 [Xenopus tropicalis]|nr:hypothetical protein XENTR_v10020783 [Xenopus tropicalis]